MPRRIYEYVRIQMHIFQKTDKSQYFQTLRENAVPFIMGNFFVIITGAQILNAMWHSNNRSGDPHRKQIVSSSSGQATIHQHAPPRVQQQPQTILASIIPTDEDPFGSNSSVSDGSYSSSMEVNTVRSDTVWTLEAPDIDPFANRKRT
eukprot:PhF_6_TR38079/c0_g1_i1/m.56791